MADALGLEYSFADSQKDGRVLQLDLTEYHSQGSYLVSRIHIPLKELVEELSKLTMEGCVTNDQSGN